MSAKKRGLGRGLDALLGGNPLEAPSAADSPKTLSVERLRPGRFQPRKDIDPVRLRELADSISAQGVVQPVVVRPADDGRYEIIAGERRWRAAQLAGLHDVPVVVRDVSDQAALAIALIENIQREDLNPLEEAEALKRLAEEYGLTHQQLADSVGKSRVTVTNLLRLNDLHPEAKALLLSGELEMGHARALLGLEPDAQASLARKVAAQKLTVRATELLVQKLREGNAPAKPRDKDPDIRRLEQSLASRIGAPVVIRHGRKGAGQLIIQYENLDQLEGVLERINRDR
jgi:ParB family chromosome partitioning protein